MLFSPIFSSTQSPSTHEKNNQSGERERGRSCRLTTEFGREGRRKGEKEKNPKNAVNRRKSVFVMFCNNWRASLYVDKTTKTMKDHIVKSMMALTMSLSHFFSAFTALPLLQLACCITNSISLPSTPSSSTSSSDSSSTGAMTLVGSAI